MLDRIDRTREFVDCSRECRSEIVEEYGGRDDLARLTLVGIKRVARGKHVEHRTDTHRRRCFERAVVLTGEERVVEPARRATEGMTDRGDQRCGVVVRRGNVAHRLTCLAQRTRGGVDGEGGFVAEEMADHRGENERDGRIDFGNREDRACGIETLIPFGGDDDGSCLVGTVDGDLFGHIRRRATLEARCAHEDHWLARKIDVLLVFRDVARNRLVTQLGQLDTYLVGRNSIRAVANDGPITLRWCETLGGRGDRLTLTNDRAHRVGYAAQRGENPVPDLVAARTGCGTDRTRQQCPRSDLRVEGLRAGDAHFDVAAVGRVENSVGSHCEVTVAAIHDCNHARTA